MDRSSEFPWQQAAIVLHSQRLLRSFQHWTGESLLENGQSGTIAQALFEAPFALISHGTEADPLLTYGNRTALNLWQLEWDDLIRMPSRLTAEPVERSQRTKSLQQAQAQGYISSYEGVRISSTGDRFWIRNVVIWDVLDERGVRIGQAAKIDQWEPIAPSECCKT